MSHYDQPHMDAMEADFKTRLVLLGMAPAAAAVMAQSIVTEVAVAYAAGLLYQAEKGGGS